MTRKRLSLAVQNQVRQRANFLCEYCHADEKWQYVQFTLDHIIPLKQGGDNSLNNLALACFHCNRYKAASQVAVDPLTQRTVPLFNPRRQSWSQHFIWSTDSLTVIGTSEIGRATLDNLQLNRERIVVIRAADKIANRHPPPGDPVQTQE